MVELNRETPGPGPVVTGFSGRGFKVGDRRFDGGLWLTPDSVQAWDAALLQDIAIDHLADLLALRPPPEFLLLGTGTALVHPPRDFVRAVEAMGIGIEAMDSKAAAKAWGVLRQEERWIVAALMPF